MTGAADGNAGRPGDDDACGTGPSAVGSDRTVATADPVAPTVRILDVDDADAVRAAARLRYAWWLEDGGDGDPDEDDFGAHLGRYLSERRDSHVGALVDLDGEPVGVGWVVVVDRLPWPHDPNPRAGLVQAVYVDIAHRGAGAGYRLLEFLIDECRAAGLKYLLVNPTERAEALYRRLGFRGAKPPLRLDLRESGT